jgi:phospholipase/lecithinase/hemolysin
MLLGLPDLSGVPELIQKGPVAQQEAKEISDMHNKKLYAMIEKLQKQNPDVQFVVVDVMKYMDDLLKQPGSYNMKNIKDACYNGGYYINHNLANKDEIAAAKLYNLDIMNNISLRTVYLNSIIAAKHLATECEEPDTYLYWDQVHPTRITHHILATLAVSILNENDVNGPANAKRL